MIFYSANPVRPLGGHEIKEGDMPTATTQHPDSRRKMLRAAGLSQESELSEARIARADSAEAKEVLEASGKDALYRFIMGAGREPGAKAASKKYSDEVRRAARVCRELTAGKGSPGAKQVDAVAKAIGETDPIEASGMAGRTLRRYATEGRTAKGELMRPTPEMSEIGERCGGDPFCRGRRLAVILAALDAVRKSGAES